MSSHHQLFAFLSFKTPQAIKTQLTVKLLACALLIMTASIAQATQSLELGDAGNNNANISGNNSSIAETNYEQLVARFESRLRIKILSVSDSSVPGILQITANNGIYYASENGEFFINGRIYRVGQQIIDETEEALKKYRLEGVSRFSDSSIEFKADKEKYQITVFTDATCGFCRKLHNEMDILNDLGISVRYLAFPRAGINSPTYRDAVSIWCSSDTNKAMNTAKAGKQVMRASCENEVAEQYNFGQAIGVNGTPNIILPDGSVINGYQPAQQLLQSIQAAVY